MTALQSPEGFISSAQPSSDSWPFSLCSSRSSPGKNKSTKTIKSSKRGGRREKETLASRRAATQKCLKRKEKGKRRRNKRQTKIVKRDEPKKMGFSQSSLLHVLMAAEGTGRLWMYLRTMLVRENEVDKKRRSYDTQELLIYKMPLHSPWALTGIPSGTNVLDPRCSLEEKLLVSMTHISQAPGNSLPPPPPGPLWAGTALWRPHKHIPLCHPQRGKLYPFSSPLKYTDNFYLILT